MHYFPFFSKNPVRNQFIFVQLQSKYFDWGNQIQNCQQYILCILYTHFFKEHLLFISVKQARVSVNDELYRALSIGSFASHMIKHCHGSQRWRPETNADALL